MKKLFLITLCMAMCCTYSVVFSQTYSVKGSVIDQNKKAVQFADVTLLKNDSIRAYQTITDSLGHYSLQAEKGNYLLNIKQFGKNSFSQAIEIDRDETFAPIEIQKTAEIEGVVISSRKKLMEQKVDRLVYNIENSIASQGMSGLDALRSTPLVNVINDNISIVGKGNVSVMVNDRMLNLSGSELTSYLQSLRSDDIAKIEVITAPPSKYEAQGNSGLINIILKKNPNLGWSGSVNGSFQRSSMNGFRTGGTLNYQSEKVSSTLKLSQGDINYQLNGTRSLIGSQSSILNDEKRHDNPKIISLNYNVDYKINKNQNAGLVYSYSKLNYDMDTNGNSWYRKNNVLDSLLTTTQKQRWVTPTHTLNTYYDIKLDSIGKKLSLAGNYLNNSPEKLNDFSTLNTLNNQVTTIQNNSKMKYSIASFQTDLTLPTSTFTMETGLKYTWLSNTSDVAYYQLQGNDFVLNPNNSNVFQYKEHNYAAYVSFNKDFNEKWSAKVGLRYEYSQLEGFTPGDHNSEFSNRYGKLFPTAYISYKPNKENSLSINYSKRINRPDFQSLNPFRWYTNPYMYYTGNPVLQPSFNDNVELNYSYKGKLTLGIYNQYSQSNLSNIARLVNGMYSNIIENGYNQNRTGLNIGYYDTFFKIWETSITANGSYTTTSPTIPELEKLKVYSLSYTFYNTIALNEQKTWSLMLNFWHSLPFTYANVQMKDQLEFSPGIKASFFDKKLQANLVISDLFKTLRNRGFSNNGDFRSEFEQYNDYRNIKLSATYTFGNKKVTGANKTIKFEESSRAN